VLLSACGSDSGGESGDDAPVTATGECSLASTPAPADKPAVDPPSEVPTELKITDLTEGSGPAAKDGDTVSVQYVGVRQANGEEFDSNYGDAPLDVPLGAGRVIQGWDQGLVGVKAGGRRQLDIPTELAYGDHPSGDVIQPGDALTFVVDVVAIVPSSDPADKPTVEVKPSKDAKDVTTKDLVTGNCATAEAGQTAYVQLIAYNGNDGKELQSTWETGQPIPLPLDDQTIDGIVQGMQGMKVGGRRLLVIPPALAFGESGNDAIGLPAGADLILVIDLVALGAAS
jgi:peptidylprolyl isomerase